ncbi:hypothetical protein HanOQP8_Chr05g0180421 [Helianthus annuus]|nr:hypothetical protein HanOQP8_Chr05g0180421 [Helianthus annuus]
MGFYSFCQQDGSPKLMVPLNVLTKWKRKFFYIKAAAITTRLQFRNVTDTIITENISVPRADTVDWFPNLRIIGWFKLDNSQLWVLRMMSGRMSMNTRPVVREKSSGKGCSPLENVHPDFKGKVAVVACEDGEEGFNLTIRDNFRVPDPVALKVELLQGKGDLEALGDPAARLWETLLRRVFLNSPRRRWATSGFASRRNRMSRLLFLLWCRRW